MGPQPLIASGTAFAGRVTALATDPANGLVVYAGTADGGVWKSSDGGGTWTPRTDDQPTLAIGAIAVDPRTPTTVYAGTGEANDCGDCLPSQGILKSTDGGTTWATYGQSIFTADSFYVASLAVDRTNGVVFAATNRGLYQSTDGGVTWVQKSSGSVQQIAQDPKTPTTWWAAFADWCSTSTSEPGRVATTTDAGTTWTTLYTAPSRAARIALALGTNGATVTAYASVAACPSATLSMGQLLEVWKTSDGGSTHIDIKPGPALPDYFAEPGGTEWQGWYDNMVAVDPIDPNHAVFGGVTMVVTKDGGASFTDVAKPYAGGPLHPDFHTASFVAHDMLYVGNDGGVWKSNTPLGGTGAAADWSDLNQGFDTIQFYAGTAVSLNWAAGGSQDNGTAGLPGAPSDPGAHPWDLLLGGDGGWTALDPKQPNITYAEYTNLDIWRLDAGTGTLTAAGPCPVPCGERAAAIAPYLMDASMPSRLYAGSYRVYRTTNGGIPAGTGSGGSWNAVSGDLTSGSAADTLHAMALGSGPTAGELATGSAFGKVFLTRNADQSSPSWLDISAGLPAWSASADTGNPWISSIAINPQKIGELWVAISQLGAGRIWHSGDGGASWSDLTGAGATALPNVVVDTITVDPTDPKTIYAGTDQGAYVCTSCADPTPVGSWMPLGTLLPNVRVNAINVTHDGSSLVAWTHGRGAWSLPRPVPAPVASITPKQVDFGDQNIKSMSSARTVTLTNSGTAPLQISRLDITGDFSQSNDCGAVLAPKTSCSIHVTFAPTGTGYRDGNLTISDDAMDSPQSIYLSGNGTYVAVQLQPSTLTFASQTVRTTSPPQSVTVTNTGTGVLTISGITTSGDFAQTNDCPTKLGAGATCTISVTFTPTTTGQRTGTLAVSDDASPSPQTVALNATGRPAPSWESLGGVLTSGPGVASWAQNRLDVFVRGGDNGLWHRWWDGQGWAPWQSLGGGQFKDDPASVSWSRGDGSNRIDVFYRGVDDQLWHRWWNGFAWSSPEPQGGTLSSGPSVASWAANRLDAFIRGSDQQLWHKWWDGIRWSGWEPLGGQLASDPEAVSWGSNRIDVFVKGIDNQAWHKWWDGVAWSAWEPQGGSVSSGLAVASPVSNRLELVMASADSLLWRRTWDGSTWGSWSRLDGTGTSDPAAVAQNSASVDLFIRRGDQALWHEMLYSP